MKKLLSALLAVSVVFGAGSAVFDSANYSSMQTYASSEYTEGTYGYLTYKNYGDYIEITDCDVSATSVEIPSEIDGVPVTSIGDDAFYECSNSSVIIPNSITCIGNRAFYSCSNLESITIPNSVTIIGNNAFTGCYSLTFIAISDSVESIGLSAFNHCSGLTSITVPDSVTSIGYGAFSYCGSLTEILVDENNQYYTSDNGVLFNKDKTTLCAYPYGKKESKYIIPDSVTSIGNDAFCDCDNLTSVTIPDSVTSIECSAFIGCSGLTSITIPDSVKSIGNYAFYYCDGLTSVTIPDSVTSIGAGAFSGFTGTMHGYEGSYAQTYAKENNITFSVIKQDIAPKIYEQMNILANDPLYYGNSQTVQIIEDYRNMAIADPEVESYHFWKNIGNITDGNLSEEEFNQTMTVQALITEIFLNEELIASFDKNTADLLWKEQKEVLTGIKNNASDWSLSEEALNKIDTIISTVDYSSEFFDKSVIEVCEILKNINGQELTAFEKFIKGYAGKAEIAGGVGTVLELFQIFSTRQEKIENAAQLYELYLACLAYQSSSAQFRQAVQFMSDSVAREVSKYTGNDDFAKRMREVGALYQKYYEIILDETKEQYKNLASELSSEIDFNKDHQWETFKGKAIAIGVIAAAFPEIAFALKTAGIVLDVGVSLWEITSGVDERALERDKFLNMILFYDSFSNALYSKDGFYGLLLDDPSEESYQTFLNGVKMYLIAEEMTLEYAANYSIMLRQALRDWKNVFVLIDTYYLHFILEYLLV